MRFDWDDLRYFLAVARVGTVSGAARRLGVDHATVIRRIDALERALTTTLFERNLRGYDLTRSGIKLLESANRIDSEATKVEAEVGSANDVAGTIRVSSLEGFANFFLAGHLPRFARANPRLRIELLTIQQIIALSRREADIAITVNPPEHPSFERSELVTYRLFIYGSRNYLAGAPSIASRTDLTGHPFTGYIDDLIFTRGLDYLDEILPGLRPSLRSSSIHAQMEFACGDHGLCVLPSFVARTRPELRPVLKDQVMLERRYWLVQPARSETTMAVHTAAQFIRQTVAASQSQFR